MPHPDCLECDQIALAREMVVLIEKMGAEVRRLRERVAALEAGRSA
jgi:hypothetical protein